MASQPDQQHPQEQRDRAIVERAAREGLTDYNLVEVARLTIRYRRFPGARDLQRQLAQLVQAWGLSEDELFARARQLHASGQVYRNTLQDDRQDWS